MNNNLSNIAKQLKFENDNSRFSAPKSVVNRFNLLMHEIRQASESKQEKLAIEFLQWAKQEYKKNGKTYRVGKEDRLILAGYTDHCERIGDWIFSFVPFTIGDQSVGFKTEFHSKDRNGKESIPVFCFHAGMNDNKAHKYACKLSKTQLRRVYNK